MAQEKVLDPINAVITFNVAVRPDEGMPVEGVIPVQFEVPASGFGQPLVAVLEEALRQRLADAAEGFRLAGTTRPEDLPSPEPLELPEEEAPINAS